MTTYRPKPELHWKSDPAVEAARKLPDWPRFHRLCGQRNVFFDHIERDGRRSAYRAHAFTLRGKPGHWTYHLLAEGTGATVLEALGSAFAGCGVAVPEAAALLAAGLTGAPPAGDDFDALIEDDFEELL